jgi:hypothetical protein
MTVYYDGTSTANYCPHCGRDCWCTRNTSGIYVIYSRNSGSNFDGRRAEQEKRDREEEEALRRYAMWRASIELGRDYSLRPARAPRSRHWVPSVSFHWMSQRKRAFKLRPSRPGWDRGR